MSDKTPTENKNKGDSIWNLLLWWKTDEQEVNKQVEQYNKLSILKSKKGRSFLLLSILALLSFTVGRGTLLNAGLLFIIAFFVYKGNRWIMMGIMIWMTYFWFNRLYIWIIATSNNGINRQIVPSIATYLFWAIPMHVIFYAYKVEQERAKQRKENKTVKEIKPEIKPEIKQNNNLLELEKLAELKDKKIITEDDFNKKKKQILGL